MGAWLQIDGSLSARIASVSGKLDGARAAPGPRAAAAGRGRAACGCPAGAGAHGREVILLADGVPVVYARSVLQAVHARGTWKAIRGLGNRALADLLFGQPAAQRSGFEFARFAPGSGIAATVHRRWRDATGTEWGRREVWARCSVFTRRGAPLLVTECFAPAIAAFDAPAARARRAVAAARAPRILGSTLRRREKASYFEAAPLQFVAKPGRRAAVRGTIGMATTIHVATLIRCSSGCPRAALMHATSGWPEPVAPMPHKGAPRAGPFTANNHPRTRLEPLPPRHARGRPVAGFRHASLLRRRCRRLRRRAGRQRACRGAEAGLDKAGMDPVGAPAGRPVPRHERRLGQEDRDPGRQGVAGARSTSCASCPTSASRTSSRTSPPSRSRPARSTPRSATSTAATWTPRPSTPPAPSRSRRTRRSSPRSRTRRTWSLLMGQLGQLHRHAAGPGRRPRRQGSDDLFRRQPARAAWASAIATTT